MTDETSDIRKHSGTPALTPREKFINAIPLVLVALTLAYFAYSCSQNRKTVQLTTDFVQQYTQISNAFDQDLDKCLHKNIPPEEYRKLLQETHIPNLRELQKLANRLPKESSAYVIAFPQIVDVLKLKMRLANVIVEDQKPDSIQELFDLLTEINQLQQQIHAETEKHQK